MNENAIGIRVLSIAAVGVLYEDKASIGSDMKTKYKERARGGLAVNIVEC
jgi:hypothetical protein